MAGITLEQARTIIAGVRDTALALGLKPISVVVLDSGGHVRAFEREDGASNGRFQIAHGKAHGGRCFRRRHVVVSVDDGSVVWSANRPSADSPTHRVIYQGF